MKLVHSLVAAIALSSVPVVVNGAVRGLRDGKDDKRKVLRQLMMSAPPGCPNLARGRDVSKPRINLLIVTGNGCLILLYAIILTITCMSQIVLRT